MSITWDPSITLEESGSITYERIERTPVEEDAEEEDDA